MPAADLNNGAQVLCSDYYLNHECVLAESEVYMASQGIEPEESISQVGFSGSAASTASTSRTMGGSSQSAFLSHFSSSTRNGLGDNFLLIENDPVTLARSQAILKVINSLKRR